MPNRLLTHSMTKNVNTSPTPTTGPADSPSRKARASGDMPEALRSIRCIISAWKGAMAMLIGMVSTSQTKAPVMPASRPVTAPSPTLMGSGWDFCIK